MIEKSTILSLIDSFCKTWEKIKKQKDSIEKKNYTSKLAEYVQELDSLLSKSHDSQELLFYYLLHTIWGAPFVFSLSLHEASQTPKEFKALINHMLDHSQIIDKEIKVAREQYLKSFCKKKSA